MNEHAEPTEMAGVAEAETQAAYAWGALDYDDSDEFPTVPTPRLTSRRITALALAASLVLIAVAGAVALFVVRDTNQPVVQASSPPVVETTMSPAPPPTVTVTPPPAPPSSTVNEANFVSVVHTVIPIGWTPGGTITSTAGWHR